jgi:hypothetical protein
VSARSPCSPDFPLILTRSIRESARSLRAAAWLGHPDESLEVSRLAKLWTDTEAPEQLGATKGIYRNLANRPFSFSLDDKSPSHSPSAADTDSSNCGRVTAYSQGTESRPAC